MKFESLPTPCYVIDKALLKQNLELIQSIEQQTGCHILLAQKGFSAFCLYPFMKKYLYGTTASSLFEAKLGREEMGGETHIFSPAYRPDEIDEILSLCDHVVFNSFAQWNRFKENVTHAPKKVSCGIRINPEFSEIKTDIYNPCFSGSRLGTTLEQFDAKDLEGIDGLHFHTMCEQNSDTLWRTLQVVDQKFGAFLPRMKWINFGGGHHITRSDYDVNQLIKCIEFVKEKYPNLTIYLEPGEGIALNTGFLISTVLDTMKNGIDIAILDTSAACHMPDVLEMPYRPEIIGAGLPNEKPHTYRLGGPTCLAGDIIGDYSFEKPLAPGDRLIFCDMAHYSMVKNNTFNGMNLPAIVVKELDGDCRIIRKFGYEDFKTRLS